MPVRRIRKHSMTYGEACYMEQHSEEMIDGEFVPMIIVENKPDPMSFDLDGKGGSPGGRYYTEKLRPIFEKVKKPVPKITLNMNREKMIGIAKEAYEAGRRSA